MFSTISVGVSALISCAQWEMLVVTGLRDSLTLVSLSLLSELGKIDGVFAFVGHLFTGDVMIGLMRDDDDEMKNKVACC